MSKLNSEAFPYPVLTDQENNDDYYNSFFESEISVELKEEMLILQFLSLVNLLFTERFFILIKKQKVHLH